MTTSEPFGVTAESREAIRAWSGPGDRPHRTIVLAAFLVGTINNHLSYTSFGHRSSTALSLYSAVDTFARASPGLCGAAMHVVHDIPGLGDRHLQGHSPLPHSHSPLLNNRSVSVRDSTTYHGFTPRADYTHACDRRWVLYVRVLKRIEWDCAFAVDLVRATQTILIFRFRLLAAWPVSTRKMVCRQVSRGKVGHPSSSSYGLWVMWRLSLCMYDRGCPTIPDPARRPYLERTASITGHPLPTNTDGPDRALSSARRGATDSRTFSHPLRTSLLTSTLILTQCSPST